MKVLALAAIITALAAVWLSTARRPASVTEAVKSTSASSAAAEPST
jgi:hypothetical protein